MKTTTHIAARLTASVMAALLLPALPAAAKAAESNVPPLAAAPLAENAGYELPNGSERVRFLQRRLRLVGAHPGPIDGRFGPLTEAAVKRFQGRQALAADGLVGPETEDALRRATELIGPGAGYGGAHGSARVRKLQRSLRLVGAHPGRIDGRFGPLTEAAVIRFQRRQGLTADGLVGDATMAALTSATTGAPDRPASDRPADGRNRAPGVDKRRAEDSQSSGSAFGSPLSVEVTLALAAGVALWFAAAIALVRAWRKRRVQRSTSGAVRVGGRPDPLGRLAAPSPRRDQHAVEGPPVLGYATVPRAAKGRHREELPDQLEAIMSECRRRELVLVDIVREHEPDHGKGLQRPGLGYALRRIADGEANGLVVAELSRISRSVTDLGEVLEWFSETGARLVAATPGLDTGEQGGWLAARALIDVSSWERERLSDRTRKGLEAASREGRRRGRSGVADNPELNERIARMRAEGMTLQAIADRLNEEAVPTIRGGALWRPSSVQAAVGYHRPPHRGPGSAGHGPGGPTDNGEEV